MTNIRVQIDGLRNPKGLVHLCLTSDPHDFPKCRLTGARHATIKAGPLPPSYEFRSVPLGTYAVAAFHDANSDGKLNTVLGIPTEGFAFSRNPKTKPRAPLFSEASFKSNGRSLETLRMKYLFQ